MIYAGGLKIECKRKMRVKEVVKIVLEHDQT
jgi:hypothetical protein